MPNVPAVEEVRENAVPVASEEETPAPKKRRRRLSPGTEYNAPTAGERPEIDRRDYVKVAEPDITKVLAVIEKLRGIPGTRLSDKAVEQLVEFGHKYRRSPRAMTAVGTALVLGSSPEQIAAVNFILSEIESTTGKPESASGAMLLGLFNEERFLQMLVWSPRLFIALEYCVERVRDSSFREAAREALARTTRHLPDGSDDD